MKTYLYFGLFIFFFFSCDKGNNDYKIEQMNHGYYSSLKLIDKNNLEVIELNILDDGTIIRYSINELEINDNKNFSLVINLNDDGTIVSYVISSSNLGSIMNLSEEGINSYLINDGIKYYNRTNFGNYFNNRDDNEYNPVFLSREELLNQDVWFKEIIFENGSVIKEKQMEE